MTTPRTSNHATRDWTPADEEELQAWADEERARIRRERDEARRSRDTRRWRRAAKYALAAGLLAVGLTGPLTTGPAPAEASGTRCPDRARDAAAAAVRQLASGTRPSRQTVRFAAAFITSSAVAHCDQYGTRLEWRAPDGEYWYAGRSSDGRLVTGP